MTECITFKYNIWVSRKDVRKAIKVTDPERVNRRRKEIIYQKVYEFLSRENIYGFDGNDKLRRWGLYINGCVDGLGRKILRLVASSTNSDRLVIGNCFFSV